jgi:hypothetical protein
MNTRRQFLIRAPLGVLVVAAACRKQGPPANSQTPSTAPGAPPTFGTGVGSGPPVSPETFAEAEKLMQVTMTPAERQQAADSWRSSLAPYLERRSGPRKVAIEATDSPATLWNPMIPGIASSPARDQFVRSNADSAPLPSADDAIAFAPVTQLSRWIESHQLTSERLTNIYLSRIERLDPKIRAIITLTKDHALARAKQADAEIANGKYRGPLHGIPYGVKDLLDTKDIPTTYGAEPFRSRVPSADSAVVRRLDDAGAVLLAKLSLGALALNDIWFGGQTMNPWLLEEGASGSSAGPRGRDGCGAGGIFRRQRDGRQHRQSRDALWRDRPAPDIRPRRTHRRDDAVLVARQTRSDDSFGRRRDARASSHHRPGCRRCVERPQPPRL